MCFAVLSLVCVCESCEQTGWRRRRRGRPRGRRDRRRRGGSTRRRGARRCWGSTRARCTACRRGRAPRGARGGASWRAARPARSRRRSPRCRPPSRPVPRTASSDRTHHTSRVHVRTHTGARRGGEDEESCGKQRSAWGVWRAACTRGRCAARPRCTTGRWCSGTAVRACRRQRGSLSHCAGTTASQENGEGSFVHSHNTLFLSFFFLLFFSSSKKETEGE